MELQPGLLREAALGRHDRGKQTSRQRRRSHGAGWDSRRQSRPDLITTPMEASIVRRHGARAGARMIRD
eukprot:6641782-Pyramimonas_sp.AAC.1